MTRQIGGGVLAGSSVRSTSIVGMWAVIQAGETGKLHSSFNVASYTDNGAGDHTLTYNISFASASDYVVVGSANTNVTGAYTADGSPPAAGSARIVTANTSAALVDSDPTTVIAVGRR